MAVEQEEDNNSSDYISDSYDSEFGENAISSYDDYGSTVEKHSDLLKSLTDFEPFLKQMVSEWLGLVWSSEKGKEGWIKDKTIDPIMNMTGARWAINSLRPYTRKNNIITSLEKEDYIDMMEDIIDNTILNIGTRCDEFAIKNDGDMRTIYFEIIHAAQLVLIGASGKYRYVNFLDQNVKHTDNISYNPYAGQNMQQQKPGMIQKFKSLVGMRM